MNTEVFEVNFDGIVGNTHNYSGLSYGNIASKQNQLSVSNPKDAALQGLKKMKLLADLGLVQAVLPPQLRPHIKILHLLGFEGKDSEILNAVNKKAPHLLTLAASSACMWAANAATISSSNSTLDHKVHITPANLSSKFHRSIESEATANILKEIFKDERFFFLHPPLPPGEFFSDEGAANHMHLCSRYGDPGLDIFVYGKSAFAKTPLPKHFPPRQTLEASEAISRLHKLKSSNVCFLQQNPKAIDKGVFHNDVIVLSNQNILIFHDEAFLNKDLVIKEIQEKAKALQDLELKLIEVKKEDISLVEAISSYFFNSQLVSRTENKMLLIAPEECKENKRIKQYIDALIQSSKNSITDVVYLNLRQSMQNGGGPACLRFRAILTKEELKNINEGVILTEPLYAKLESWIDKHYRDRLDVKDLADPQLLKESYAALSELESILKLKIL